jgi:ABC-2 type transport system ATP-binding protein
MQSTIEVDGLTKRFGRTVAVDDLSFAVQPGKVTGFIGPNGAGKSTTMRLVMGLDFPQAGTATVAGRRYRDLPEPLTTIGALLDAGAPHPGRTARNHLLWLAYSNGIGRARVDAVLAQVGLESVANRRVGGYSLGMRQRLGIAAALLGDPAILMLDEPVNGLDPEGIVWIRGLLRDLAAQGRTILVSSHLMSELQDTADHLLIVGRGRLIADTSTADLLARASGDRLDVRTDMTIEVMTVLSGAGATVATTEPLVVTVSGLPGEKVVSLLGSAGVSYSELRRHQASLEEAYMELTREVTQFAASEPS